MKNSIKKWVEDLNRHFFKDIIGGQEAHEKMLNITYYLLDKHKSKLQ